MNDQLDLLSALVYIQSIGSFASYCYCTFRQQKQMSIRTHVTHKHCILRVLVYVLFHMVKHIKQNLAASIT
jgi:hypothetical protein